MGIKTRTSGIMVNINVTPATVAGSSLLTGLVSYWDFNNNLLDSAPAGNTLTLNGGSSNYVAGVVDQAFNWPSGGGTQDCVTSNAASLGITGTDFSYSVWVNKVNTNDNDGILARYDGATGN